MFGLGAKFERAKMACSGHVKKWGADFPYGVTTNKLRGEDGLSGP